MKPTRYLCLILVLIATASSAQQKHTQPKAACDDGMNFCWFSGEVNASGQRWVSQDKKDRIEAVVALRCFKSLGVCAYARKHNIGGKDIVAIDLLSVVQWDGQQITAKAEAYDIEPCDRDTYVINRVDRTVLLISSPGPKGDMPVCTNILGKPRTVTYTLTQ